jgi:16S rRNA (uracil1498-N3)-methyltransferase
LRRRFFVDAFDADRAVLTGEAAHHLGRVLRAEPGQLYELSDGRSVRLGKVASSGRDRVEFSLLDRVPVRVSPLEKTLLLAVVKFEAFEWALEKATELGVNRIVPLAAARSEKGLLAAAGKRAARWARIVFEASQQSRRVSLPVIEDVRKPAPAFGRAAARVKVMLSERTGARPLREILADGAAATVALAVGPEGGWTDEELAAAGQAGFQEVSLGPLILRTETAVTACLAATNYALEPSFAEKNLEKSERRVL